jgi:hypothetical protein
MAGAVEPLPVLDGDRGHRRQRPRLAQHPLGEIRLETEALEIAPGEPAALVEHGVRDAEEGVVEAVARDDDGECRPRASAGPRGST